MAIEGKTRSLPPQTDNPAGGGMQDFYRSARNDLIVSQAIADSFAGSWDSRAQFALKTAVMPALQTIQSACGRNLTDVTVLKEG